MEQPFVSEHFGGRRIDASAAQRAGEIFHSLRAQRLIADLVRNVRIDAARARPLPHGALILGRDDLVAQGVAQFGGGEVGGGIGLVRLAGGVPIHTRRRGPGDARLHLHGHARQHLPRLGVELVLGILEMVLLATRRTALVLDRANLCAKAAE
jgi:hypothetical protein